ncbi:hypothetical protein [Pseudomonas sp. RGM2987]|uniref:hypothetical protein n=1 Tax=Pseudomonas sp. RGM2987 TaxID=2930090 RepID=UPI001FD6E933|nr:hypothetical protein [Pseudomonas sp. RGM2987]MCJ8204682.1 hypothetical protein [Pseudomonas sp. RGM2987]
MRYVDHTTFDAQDRNGWVDGNGAIGARLVADEQGRNIFWAGEMIASDKNRFLPGLYKQFNFKDPELAHEHFHLTFRYRIKEQPGKLGFAFLITESTHSGWVSMRVNPQTCVGEWVEVDGPVSNWFARSNELQIGVCAAEMGKTFGLEFADIRLEMIPA